MMQKHGWPAPTNLEENLKKLKYFKYYPSFDLDLDTNHLMCFLIPPPAANVRALYESIEKELTKKWGNTIIPFANAKDKAIQIKVIEAIYTPLSARKVAEAVEIEKHLEKLAVENSLQLCSPPPGSVPEKRLATLIQMSGERGNHPKK